MRVAPGTVWQQWLALRRWPSWQPESQSVRWLGGGGWEEGSRFELLRATPYGVGPARRYVGVVLSLVEEQLLLWELRPVRAAALGPVLVESVRLTPAPGGTTVTLSITAHGALPRLIGPLLVGPLHRQATATLEGLHHALLPMMGGR